MTPADIAALTPIFASVVREYTSKAVTEALAPVLARNAALEQRILELETRPEPVPLVGPAGEKGEIGPGVASVLVTADGRLMVHLTDGRSLDAGPAPRGPAGERGEKGEPGAPGRDGHDGPPGAVGLQGEKGMDGLDGKDGATGLQGENGLDGIHGRDGRDGEPGLPGEKGIDGRNGVDGLNGKDGQDGLGFDDADLVLDENRGWIFRLIADGGLRIKEWILGLPFDAKVWEAGLVYPKGAGVTWDGNWWIAQLQTSEQPGEGSPAWRLAVRRGKQGREGKPGKEGAPGRDLTQMDPSTGRKW